MARGTTVLFYRQKIILREKAQKVTKKLSLATLARLRYSRNQKYCHWRNQWGQGGAVRQFTLLKLCKAQKTQNVKGVVSLLKHRRVLICLT